MPTPAQTAEEIIQGFRKDVLRELDHARFLAGIPSSEGYEAVAEQVGALRGMAGDVEELVAALAALDVALIELAKPMKPVRDELRD